MGKASTCLADFHAFVTAQPSACALVHHDRDAGSSIQLTYRDLADMAVAAGLGLHEAGLHRGCPIVSFCDESPAVVIAFLGIASAGGVVVPIDPAAPEARLQSMIADCGARLALCVCEWKEALESKVCGHEERLHLVTLEAAMRAGRMRMCHESSMLPLPQPDDHLHLIYTSGSTGRPKAVLVTHGAMHAYARAKSNTHGIQPALSGAYASACASRVLLASAHTWDPCIGDTLSTLAAGATLCTAPRAQLLQAFGGTMQALRVTHVCATPSLWSLLSLAPSQLPSLQFVALGGEALPFALVAPWLAHSASAATGLPSGLPVIANTYGVTEVTVYQTIGACATAEARGTASAGWPFASVDLALDTALDTGRSGGEILLAGEQMAVGYHGRPELTAERFVWLGSEDVRLWLLQRRRVDTIETADGSSGSGSGSGSGRGSSSGSGSGSSPLQTRRLWFRTGDLGVWEGEGSGLRVLGRIDAQIKLRGIRVELGEIEAVARQSSVITGAAATVIDDQLILFVVPATDELSLATFHEAGADVAVRLQLRKWLPPSLQPTRLVAIERLPLTAGGKLLRSSLPSPPPPIASPTARGTSAIDDPAKPEEALRGATELAVAKAWAETLPHGVPAIGPHSNFWELGGTSLIAVKMLDKLRRYLDASSAGGTDAFERGNQRFATRLCGLYRKPQLRDYCVWLQWAALPAPAALSSDTTADAIRSFERLGEFQAAADDPAGVLRDSDGALFAAGDLAFPESAEMALAATAVLSFAAQLGGRRLVSELLAANADPDAGNSRTRREPTPLMHAASRHECDFAHGPQVVATLLAAGARVNAATRTQATALHRAAAGGCAASLALLLRSEDCARDARDLNKWSALFHAAWAGATACVQLLLACDAPVNEIDRWRRSPLCWACAAGHVDVVRCLLGANADACGPSKPQKAHLERFSQMEWSTPLHLALHEWCRRRPGAFAAATSEEEECRAALATQEPAEAAPTEGGATEMMSEMMPKSLELIQLLLDAGANPTAPDQNGLTPIELVRQRAVTKDAELAVALIEESAARAAARGHRSSRTAQERGTTGADDRERDPLKTRKAASIFLERDASRVHVRRCQWPPGSKTAEERSAHWVWPPFSTPMWGRHARSLISASR